MLLNIKMDSFADVFIRIYSGYRVTIANQSSNAVTLKAGTTILGFGKVWGEQSDPLPGGGALNMRIVSVVCRGVGIADENWHRSAFSSTPPIPRTPDYVARLPR